MVPEQPLEATEHGLVAGSDGWFVMNAAEARWRERGGRGSYCDFEGDSAFAQVGINIQTLAPGEPMAMYHWEADQEDFLVLPCNAMGCRRKVRLAHKSTPSTPPCSKRAEGGHDQGRDELPAAAIHPRGLLPSDSKCVGSMFGCRYSVSSEPRFPGGCNLRPILRNSAMTFMTTV
jgi:hypothetical protein